jgi:membrane protease YdiL (CAAX protease family)
MPDQTSHNPLYSRAERYWTQSRRPFVSLIFIAPLMVIYEAGVVFWSVQNGADFWMRQLLDLMGFSQHLLLPMLTICILLAWHYLTHEPWRFSPGVLSTMIVECLFLAICLQVLLIFQGTLLLAVDHQIVNDPDVAPKATFFSVVAKMVVYLGAGIYEELLFRLILLSAIIWLIRRWWPAPKTSVLIAVLVSSLVFTVAHYVGDAGDAFHWFSFLFRFMAGVFFSAVFIFRGFGIAVGTHAAFDILVILFLEK